jgi:hypothetical protein
MLLHRKGKLNAKSKSSRLSYSVVVNLSLNSMLSKISHLSDYQFGSMNPHHNPQI